MANLKVNNYHNLRLRINKDEYWDFFVNKDSYGHYGFNSDNCLINKIDFGNVDCDSGWVVSDADYAWENALSLGYTLYNITYTSVDNGLFTFKKDRISNKDFLEIFQSNKFEIYENDTRLRLHAVSGNTQQYEYPIHCEDGYTTFNGGFYQGFFKTECDKYQVLPTNFEDGETYNIEFVLNKCELEKETDKTLNDKYPDNKGIFFYIGTRAENKWIYVYDKDDVDGLEDCYQLGMDDFVDGGEIDKKDYIIGNFYDLDPEFVEDNTTIEWDDYTDYVYYDIQRTKIPYDEQDDLFEYLEIDDSENIIETSGNPQTLKWCGCEEADDEDEEYILKPYFVGCGCPIKYKKEKVKTEKKEQDFLSGCITFGDDGYIGDWDDLSDSEYDYLEPELDITDFQYYTDNGFNISEANWYYFYTDNKFMIFDRTKSGKTVKDWVEGTQYMYCGRKNNFKGNLFILMNRTKTGYTVNNIDSLRDKDANYYDPYKDLYNNALAFRITDNGEIGYRLLSIDCEKDGRDKTSIIEGYSFENVIPECEWVVVNIRMSFIGGDKMKLYFYVNGKLKYVSKELPRINLRELNELYEKQEGVPYNISIGGGTQGLAETIQYNYMLNPTRVYPLEKYFAGSFIGHIKSFKIYNCFMEQMVIESNFKKTI